MKITVAIDGPAAAGKSTVAKLIAQRLGLTYIDTGAMYRAYTWYCMEQGVDCNDHDASIQFVGKIDILLKPDGTVLCNNIDVTRAIREPRVSLNVSPIATYKEVRLFLVDLQRKMAGENSVIMDGRDIGTYVLPNADVKIYQIASVEKRAERRYKENMEKGIPCTYEDVVADVKKRDQIDSTRAFAPLRPAEDAIHLDTSDMTIDEVVAAVNKIIDDKLAEKKNG